jgi:hypothetical protein
MKRRQKVDRSKLPKRPMFMDEMVNRFKGMPAPGQYTPKKLTNPKGSVQMLMDRVNYLDEAIINNKDKIDPCKYNADVNFKPLIPFIEKSCH